jgi:hypothetical protein
MPSKLDRAAKPDPSKPDLKEPSESQQAKDDQVGRQDDRNTSADSVGRSPRSSRREEEQIASDPPIDIAGPD